MKKQFGRKELNNIIYICEILSAIIILLNTGLLVAIRNTVSYEKSTLGEITPKSSFCVIIQHNPYIGYIFIVCGFFLLIAGVYRLYSYCVRKEK